MKKLILRLLALILAVYLAGSIYPLLAHEAGHSHAPAPAPAPAPPPPAAPPVPAAPPMLDTKGAQAPPLPPTPTTTSMGGCGGATQPTPSPQPMVAETPPVKGFDEPPAPGGVCHDYVGDRIGMPPPQHGNHRTETEVTSFLQDPKHGYTEVSTTKNLPPGTVVQFGTKHVGIVGPDGKVHHYTQAAFGGGIQPPGTIEQIQNTTHTMTNYGTGEKFTVQPYKNIPIRVWLPPAKIKP